MAPFAENLHIDVNTQESNLARRISLVCVVFFSSMALGLALILMAASFPDAVPNNLAGTNPHSVLNQ